MEGETEFNVSAVVKIFGMGVVVSGTVSSGILRVGMQMRIRRSSALPPSAQLVQITKIVPTVAHRVELYRGQYSQEVTEAGPGIPLGVGVRGVDKDDLKAGDVLYR